MPLSAGASPLGGRSVPSDANPAGSSIEHPLYCLAAGCQAGSHSAPRVAGSPDTSGPPPAETFSQSALAVTSGSRVSLHWSTAADQYFLLTSASPRALPNFGSPTAVTWPTSPGAVWISTWQWWATTAAAVTVAIPANAAAGSIFTFQLYTCSSASGLCSNSPGGSGDAQVSLTVAAHWTTVSYKQDLPKFASMTQTDGSPLDVTFSGASTIWNSSEFSDALGESLKKSTLTPIADPADIANQPFASCFASPCSASSSSALSERVVYADKLVWFTQGGWEGFPGGTVANHSEIVAYNPGTAGFCTYLVPGNDNEVIGLAVTGTGKKARVWFTESDPVGGHPSIASFSPSQVGENCPNDYSLNGAGSFEQIAWPQDDLPTQIAVDPSGADLWVTDFFGNRIEEFAIATGGFTPYTYASSNAYSPHGAEPWQLVADGSYVYAIDYGDSNLIRINKTTRTVDQSPIPLTSDTEEGYGLFISGNRLYFSLSDDAQPTFGPASTIGYIDLSAWEAASAACPPGVDCAPAPTSGFVYTGLATVADPSSDADFRGIAANASGSVAIADLHQVVRLSP